MHFIRYSRDKVIVYLQSFVHFEPVDWSFQTKGQLKVFHSPRGWWLVVQIWYSFIILCCVLGTTLASLDDCCVVGTDLLQVVLQVTGPLLVNSP